MHQLRRSVSLQANPSFLNILDTIRPEEFEGESPEDETFDYTDEDPSHFSPHPTKFICKCCRQYLISKYALDDHIIRCFTVKIDQMRDIYAIDMKKLEEQIELLKNAHILEIREMEKRNDAYVEFLQKYYQDADKKWLTLYDTMFEQMKTIVIATSGETDL